MAITRFDPDESVAYAVCSSCEQELATEADANAHMAETLAASSESRSHRLRITNASRESRIRDELERLIDRALDDANEKFEELVDAKHVTEDEIATALRGHGDFADAWNAWVAGGE